MAEIDKRLTGKLNEPRYLVLGLDPGVASCGFALIDMNNHEILEMGSRLFESPVVPKTGQSKAVVRRGFRSSRRNLDRTQDRLTHCMRLLMQEGVVPEGADKEFFHTVKGDRPPLRLRVEGLDRLLTNREWALVLYSLCKRRGYIPHGEGAIDKKSEDGKVLAALQENISALENGSFRTVGEWLASLPRSRNKSGQYDKCVTHEQLTDEVKSLFSAQRLAGNPHASETFETSYLEVFDWEKSREDFDQRSYDAVGSCVYFPDKKRAARCTLTNELVSAYGALGNVTIILPSGAERRLSSAERDAYIKVLFSPKPLRGNKDCKVTFSRIRKDLDLSERASFKGVKFNDEKTREVYVPRGWRILRGTLSQEAPELIERLYKDRDLADAVFEAMAYSSSESVLQKQLSLLDLSSDKIAALCKMPYSNRALNGYGSRSKKALDILLGMFEEPDIHTLTEAERDSGLLGKRSSQSGITPASKLMPYLSWVELTGRTNNNPVVIRAMSQMRQVVNAVCREWGVPDEIHVELGRDLLLPKSVKDKISKANKKNEDNKRRIAEQIAEIAGCSPSDVKNSTIDKWRLWEEQDNQDIYTGKPISSERLVRDSAYTQVDHILPFSRTGDNSRHNKVLVLARSNQLKRDRSPREWMTSGGEDAPSWEEFKARVLENKNLSTRKKSFLLEENLTAKENEFQNRNLNDTRYMAREVCAYLSDCLDFPRNGKEMHVIPTKGAATAWLRRAWGLNFGVRGEKDRSDDRHHATDACVIAACDWKLVHKTAKYSSQRHFITSEQRDTELAETMPWPAFADDVRRCREHVIPTRYVPHRGKGELFEQTVYAYLGEDEKGKDLVRVQKSSDEKKPATRVMGNAIVSPDGKSAIKVSEMICLRLWHDPLARKGKGQWYADPIYKADLPALQNGTYIPRIAKAHVGRKKWQPIPAHVLSDKPIEIYLGDAVRVGNFIARFNGIDIDSVRWTMLDLLTAEELNFPTIGKLSNELVPTVIREDVLGHCWR